MATFDPAVGLRMIAEEEATVLYTAFPPITDGLVDHPDFDPEPFRRVRSVFTVAPPTQLRELEGKLPGSKVVTAFGMTEVAGSIAMADPRDPQELRMRPGRPLRGAEVEVHLIDDPLTAAPSGVEGEIVSRGVTLFSHYHGLEEKTAEVMDADGWFHTGDLGVITAEGLLEFRGRLKDMLKIGGENVAAIEVMDDFYSENVILCKITEWRFVLRDEYEHNLKPAVTQRYRLEVKRKLPVHDGTGNWIGEAALGRDYVYQFRNTSLRAIMHGHGDAYSSWLSPSPRPLLAARFAHVERRMRALAARVGRAVVWAYHKDKTSRSLPGCVLEISTPSPSPRCSLAS